MKKQLITFVLAVLPLLVLGQLSQDQNYRYQKTYTKAVQTESSSELDTDKIETVTYFDGLGRAKQTISYKAGGSITSPKDIVTHIEYDALGRDKKSYLPYVPNGTNSLNFRADAVSGTNFYYQSYYGNEISLTAPNPFSEVAYENSPLNRITTQAAPGEDWSLTSNHTVKMDYLTNGVNEVKNYGVDFANGNTEEPSLVNLGTYAVNSLTKAVLKDENWTIADGLNKTTEEFKNKSGNIVLKRTYEGGQKHDTQYVYDDYGNLTYVLSPEVDNISFVDVGYPSFTQNVTNNIVTGSGLVFDPSPIGVYGYTGSVILSLSNSNQLNIAVDLDFQSASYVLKRGDIVQAAEALPDVFIGGNLTRSYKIVNGNLYLSRRRQAPFPAGSSLVENYTVTLPPNMQADPTVLNNYCYQYKYDKHNRLIEKKIPGKGWESIVYDKLDRPVLTQDANLKAQNKWLFTKYDTFGRVVYSGVYQSNLSRIAMQNTLNTQTIYNESKLAVNVMSNMMVEYTNNVFPTDNNNMELLAANYYDNHEVMFYFSYNVPSTISPNLALSSKTLATANKVRVLGTNQWIHTLNYYDKKARLIYQISQNGLLGTYDTIETQYDFIGNVLQTKNSHTKNSGAPLITVDDFTYDHQGRLLTNTQTINGVNPELIVSNNYNNLGQLVKKKVGGTAVSSLQEVDVTYNVRGWMKEINDVDNLGTDLFGFKLNYNTVEGGLTSSTPKLYNGNISQTIWKTANDTGKRSYAYTYDALNRIKTAHTRMGNSLNVDMKLDLYGVNYDKNGNITDLKRNDMTSLIDNLSYTYTGNQLTKVADASGSTDGFKDVTATVDYAYDANGNMLTDKNKGITSIEYNHLNLPVKIVFDYSDPLFSMTPKAIYYTYDASGIKLRKKVYNSSSVNITTTDYAKNYVYKNNALEFFSQPEGYVEPTNVPTRPFKYTYQYKDHSGNVRLSYSDADNNGTVATSEIVKEAHYYPFGLKHQGYNNVVSSTNMALKFEYNGKEFQDELGLNWSCYGARNYDASTGRWMNLDPAANEYTGVSPYSYVANNPIVFIDPDGKRLFFVGGANNDQDGWGYIKRWGSFMTESGMKNFVRVNASGGKLYDVSFTGASRNSAYETYTDYSTNPSNPGRFKSRLNSSPYIDKAVEQIEDNIANNPLEEGEQFNLVGYSYGSVLQSHVALRLANKGTYIDNLVLIGSPVSSDSDLFKSLKKNKNIGNVIRVDIEGDLLSDPQDVYDFLKGGSQNSSDEGAHFDLARPGDDTNKAINVVIEWLKSQGVE